MARAAVSQRSEAPDLLGSQTPRVSSHPPAAASWGPQAAELAQLGGLQLDPWQRLVLDQGMALAPDGTWAARLCCLVAPRQQGKTTLLGARLLAGLVLLGERQLLAAHKLNVTLETFATVVEAMHAHPELRALVASVAWSNGEESMALANGGRLQVIAGTPRARGPRGMDLLVVDELREVAPRAWQALEPVTTAPTRGPGMGQTWTASNAGDDTTELLNTQRDNGRAGTDPRMAYWEWSADPAADPFDPAAHAQANPAYGVRLDPRDLADAAARSGADAAFRTERLCQWVPSLQGAVLASAWHAAADPAQAQPPPGSALFALDSTPDRAWSAISAAWLDPQGLLRVQLVEQRPGSAWVPARARELTARHRPPGPWTWEQSGPAADLGALLESARVPARPLPAAEYAQACQAFMRHLDAGTLRHRPDPDLDAAALAAATRPLADRWAWARRRSAAPIPALVAATCAAWQAAHRPPRAQIVAAQVKPPP